MSRSPCLYVGCTYSTVPSAPQPLSAHDTLTNPTHLLHTLPPRTLHRTEPKASTVYYYYYYFAVTYTLKKVVSEGEGEDWEYG